MSHGWHLGSLFLFFFITACGGSGHLGWKSLPVPIYADATIMNSNQAMSDLQDAFRYWHQKAGKQIFDLRGEWTFGAPYSGSPTKPDAILGNVIFFQNPWPYPGRYVGMTTVQNSDNGPVAAMVMINGANPFCNGDCLHDRRVSTRKTFAHELGHFIGLNHNDDPRDIMYPDATPGGTISELKVDEATLRLLVSEG
ncbi:MAG: matrixin family metalloprotease [Bdellovibrionales bacterium]|nr:matrixin family metalloprotease [Bdellovibrionales bacterium]